MEKLHVLVEPPREEGDSVSLSNVSGFPLVTQVVSAGNSLKQQTAMQRQLLCLLLQDKKAIASGPRVLGRKGPTLLWPCNKQQQARGGGNATKHWARGGGAPCKNNPTKLLKGQHEPSNGTPSSSSFMSLKGRLKYCSCFFTDLFYFCFLLITNTAP